MIGYVEITAMQFARTGREVYNIGEIMKKNLGVNYICELLNKLKPIEKNSVKSYKELISFVKISGHDMR